MFVVGEISTTHMQWTVGEFTYAYMRLERAAQRRDYLVTHTDENSFRLLVPACSLPLRLPLSEAVPIRVTVAHGLQLLPADMTVSGFGAVVRSILFDTCRELAFRCPRRSSCLCQIQHSPGCGTALMGRNELRIAGLITVQD